MRNIDISGIGFNKLQIFVTAAESKSFSLAAEKLNITHSAVSKNIASLEEQLNLILFIKNNNGIILTPAGNFLYEKSRELICSFNSTIEMAHEIQTGKTYTISIGYLDNSLSEELKNFFKTFHLSHPNINIILQQYNINELLKEFNNNKLDLVFISNLTVSLLDSKNVKCKVSQQCHATIFFPESHPFAKMKKVSFADLKQENFISISNENLPGYNNLIYSICENYGFKPNISKISPNSETSFLYASMGYGIILGIENMNPFNYPDIRKYITEDPLGSIIMAWHDDNANPIVKKFVDMDIT